MRKTGLIGPLPMSDGRNLTGQKRRSKPMAMFDARPVIAAGGEPFSDIMAVAAALGRDEELVVLAPFDPVPLKGALGSQGFTCDAADLGNGDWQVTFRRPS
jgi:hypothetical protein